MLARIKVIKVNELNAKGEIKDWTMFYRPQMKIFGIWVNVSIFRKNYRSDAENHLDVLLEGSKTVVTYEAYP